MNRRLIRPSLSEIKEKMSQEKDRDPGAKKRLHPPTDTHAETYYYLKQMNKKTPMAVVFADGETIEGYIEWYDRSCFKLNRDGAPNLLVFKNQVKYIHKLDEGPERESAEGDAEKRK